MTADEIARLREYAELTQELDCDTEEYRNARWALEDLLMYDTRKLLRLLDEWDALIEYVEASEAHHVAVSTREMRQSRERWAAARARLRDLGLIGGES